MSIVVRNGLLGFISLYGGGHRESGSVMRGSPELLLSEDTRNEDEVEENLKIQIESGWIRYFHWMTA